MAVARLNRPSLMIYGGTIRPGHSKLDGSILDIVSAFQSFGGLPVSLTPSQLSVLGSYCIEDKPAACCIEDLLLHLLSIYGGVPAGIWNMLQHAECVGRLIHEGGEGGGIPVKQTLGRL
jgi:hypothetical protein